MMPRRRAFYRRLLALAMTLAASAGCLPSDSDLQGEACDCTHVCADGFQCIQNRCFLLDAGAPNSSGSTGASCAK